MPLSENQLRAAHRIGQDVCVIAGPGSGKTSVLIERFRWLLDEQHVAPDRILTISFTEKAATEIKQRLVKEFKNRPDVHEQIEHAYVSTVHAFCARLLKEHAIDAGIDPEFTVLENSRPLLRRAADEVLERLYGENPSDFRHFLRCLAVSTSESGFVPDLAASLMEIYQAMRTAGVPVTEETLAAPVSTKSFERVQSLCWQILGEKVTAGETHARLKQWARDVLDLDGPPSEKLFLLLSKPARKSPVEFSKNDLRGTVAKTLQDELRDVCREAMGELLPVFYAKQRHFVVHAIQQIDLRYRALKRSKSLLDFSDLEEQAIALLERDNELQTRLQSAFDFILMDELQDTNPLQWRLLDLLRRPDTFFGVGDVNQSIFAFRHADPQLFRIYRDTLAEQGMQVDELHENYRSRKPILDAVNTVFTMVNGVESHTLEARADYSPSTEPLVEIIGAFPSNDIEDRAHIESREALWIARRIAELSQTLMVGKKGEERPATLGDFAVLGRTAAVLARVQTALEQFGIPFVVTSSRTFYEKREIRDLKLLLAVLANPLDDVALAGVLRSPFLSASDETLLRLKRGNERLVLGLDNLPEDIDFEDRRRLVALWDEIQHCRRLRHDVMPDRLLRRLLDFTGYETGLNAQEKANIEKFLAILREFCADDRPSLSELVEEINSADPEAEAAPAEASNAVRLMTIHGSKGLEFPVVFVASLHQSTNGQQPIIRYEQGIGLGIKWRNPGDPSSNCPDKLHQHIAAKRDRIEAEETNRLLYVAMTRARERLILSFSQVIGKGWIPTVCNPLGVSTTLDSSPALPSRAREQAATHIRTNLTAEDPEPLAISFAADAAPEVLISVHSPAGQYDSTTSPTSISMFTACPRQYYLARYLRLNGTGGIDLDAIEDLPDRDTGVSAAEIGTQVHAILAGQNPPDASAEAQRLAEVFLQSELARKAANASRTAREWEFAFELEDVIIRGAIDLWFEHEGRITIVDYKTDSVEPGKTDRAKFAAYSLQLRIYALALQKGLGKPVDRAYLHYLRTNEVKEVSLVTTLFDTPEAAVRAFRDAHETLTFPLTEGQHCRRCEFYRGLCPAGTRDRATSSPLPSSVAALP